MASGITIICREVCKTTGCIAVYVCKKDVEDRDLQIVKIRGVFNPELSYYAIRTCVADDAEALDDIVRLLKRRNVSETEVERYGGIVTL